MCGVSVARIGSCQVGKGAQAAHEALHEHGEAVCVCGGGLLLGKESMTNRNNLFTLLVGN